MSRKSRGMRKYLKLFVTCKQEASGNRDSPFNRNANITNAHTLSKKASGNRDSLQTHRRWQAETATARQIKHIDSNVRMHTWER